MRPLWIISIPIVVAGCATHLPVVQTPAQPQGPPVAAVAPTRLVETRYEVGGYRESPQLRHEAHAVYRQTRVPAPAANSFETVPRTSAPALANSPLPESTELAAELSIQKTITAELRSMQAAMAETECQMQAQYAVLVRQSAEVMGLRQHLETERRRVLAIPAVEAPAQTPSAAGGTPALEVKW